MSEQPLLNIPPSHYPRPPEGYKFSHNHSRNRKSSHPLFHFSDIVRYKTKKDKQVLEHTGMIIEKCVKRPNMYIVLVEKKTFQVHASQLQWVTKRNYRKAKIHYLFSQESPEFHEAVQYDDVSLYSATDQISARAITQVILNLSKINTTSVITDATACIGGNTIEFARAFNHVQAIDIDSERVHMLAHNLKLLKLTQRVSVLEADYCKIYHTIKQDIVFLDPPWGGKRYKRFEQVRLFLGEYDVADLAVLLLAHTLHIVIKVPSNFDVRHFAQTVHRRTRVVRITHKVMLIIVSASD